MKCKQCGAELPEAAKFCVFCGTEQEGQDANEVTAQQAEPTKCWQCGAELPDEAKFCFFCGTSQENPAANEAMAQEALPTVCWQCGAELPEEAAFCGFCGAERKAPGSVIDVAQVTEFEKPARQNVPDEQSPLFAEGRTYWHGFFSKDPTSEISRASTSRSPFWVLAAAANALLFSLALCNNIPQLANYGVDSFVHTVLQCIKEVVPDSRSILYGMDNYIPELNLSAIYSKFVPFALVSLAAFAVEAIVVYILLCTLKRQPESIPSLLNVISISLFPITAVSALNLLLGLIYPPLTVCTLVAAAFIHIVLLYEGIKKFAGANTSSVWQIGLTVLVVCVASMAAMRFVFRNAVSDFISALANGILEETDSVFVDVVSYLLDILDSVM